MLLAVFVSHHHCPIDAIQNLIRGSLDAELLRHLGVLFLPLVDFIVQALVFLVSRWLNVVFVQGKL